MILPELILFLDGVRIILFVVEHNLFFFYHSSLTLITAFLILLLIFLIFIFLLLLILLIQESIKLTFLQLDPQMMYKQPGQDKNKDGQHNIGTQEKLALVLNCH